MERHDLDTRTGLPDALRLLLERHPRASWEGHRHFDGLTRFWLERHLMFRRLQTGLTDEARAVLGGDREAARAATAIARLGNTLLGELHGHHAVEDVHYFPLLCGLEPRLEAGFALLDRDHRRLDPELHALAEAANAAIRDLAGPALDRTAVGRLEERLAGFGRFLDRHLTDEEEIVVPVILEHGPALG